MTEPTVERGPLTIGWNAIDPKAGMTFGELRKLVQETMRENVEDDTPVFATTRWSGRVRQLRIEEVPK